MAQEPDEAGSRPRGSARMGKRSPGTAADGTAAAGAVGGEGTDETMGEAVADDWSEGDGEGAPGPSAGTGAGPPDDGAAADSPECRPLPDADKRKRGT